MLKGATSSWLHIKLPREKVFILFLPTIGTSFIVEMLLQFAFMLCFFGFLVFKSLFLCFQFPVLQDNLEVYLGLQQFIVTSASGKLAFIF